ncbi:hypothetical protein [Sphingomonas sp. LHG3406-1]|uniref:YaaC family protein n=1 Tax=Sphingomonas sp. LHG3406-1 TaxID=2804617 RepID=UPI00261505D7|nr:hypothetical protein [Sphingomonas sp. LHG3406-1]
MDALLSRLPSLQDHYRRWKADSNCAPAVFQIDEMKTTATVQIMRNGQPHVDRALADRIFAETPFIFKEENEHGFFFAGPNDTAALPGLTDRIDRAVFGIGDIWITAPLPSGARLSKIATTFSLAYALGMLVRYFPTQWTALVRGQVADAALPTLIAAVDLVEGDYPAIVADFLLEP